MDDIYIKGIDIYIWFARFAHMNEKNDRFRRLAEKRTNAIIKKIEILSNCSNKSMYAYSAQEVNKIFSAIEAELRVAKSKFKVNTEKMGEFKL